MKKQPGAIVIVALMMVSVIVMITEQLMRSVFIGSQFTITMLDRERAKAFALSGIELAKNQLLIKEDSEADEQRKQDTNNNQQNQAKLSPTKKLLKQLLPHLNRWQTFYFNEKTEGLNGSVQVCITSEHGKINVNELFDFKKQEIKKEYEEWLSGLEIPGKMVQGELLKALKDFFIKRRKKLYDISELREIKALEGIALFYSPPSTPDITKKEKSRPNTTLALQDIFTVWTTTSQMHPLLLSDGVCAMLNVRRPHADDDIILKAQFKTLSDEYQDGWGQNWEQNWKYLSGIYGDMPKIIETVKPLFAKQFEPQIYSVLSYGKSGNTEQRLLAVLKKVVTKQPVTQPDAKGEDKKTKQKDKDSFKLIRLYWL